MKTKLVTTDTSSTRQDVMPEAAVAQRPTGPAAKPSDGWTKYGTVMTVWLDPETLLEHEEAHRIPPMEEEQFKKLCVDMAERGFLDEFPIHLMGDSRTIIDGRNRCRAARLNKIREVACVVVKTDDAVEYMYRTASLTRNVFSIAADAQDHLEGQKYMTFAFTPEVFKDALKTHEAEMRRSKKSNPAPPPDAEVPPPLEVAVAA